MAKNLCQKPVRRQLASRWISDATGGEVLTVPGTSHHVVTDRPDELADALRGAPR